MGRHGLVRGLTAVIAAGALALTACAGPSEPAGSAAPSGGASSGGAFPVTIDHAFGATTIPAAPQRIVALGYNESDFVLALGEQPVGVRDFIGAFDEDNRAWARDRTTGPPPVKVGGDEIDFEAVATLQPDLIMGVYAFLEQADYDKLSQIAPTVAAPSAETTASWQEQTRITGQALGKPAEAEHLVADVEQQFADAAAAHPEFSGKTIAVALGEETTGSYVLEPTDLRARFFLDLGFTNAERTGEVGQENFGLLDQDVLALMGVEREAMIANPVFANLDVVTQDRTFYAGTFDTEFNGALGFGSPLSLPRALEIAVPRLAAATDGDPATSPVP